MKRIQMTRRDTVDGYDDRGRPWRRTFAAGKVVALDDAAADRVLKRGTAVVVEDEPAEPAEPRHVGGGWYELPGGKRVKGRQAADRALLAQAR